MEQAALKISLNDLPTLTFDIQRTKTYVHTRRGNPHNPKCHYIWVKYVCSSNNNYNNNANVNCSKNILAYILVNVLFWLHLNTVINEFVTRS